MMSRNNAQSAVLMLTLLLLGGLVGASYSDEGGRIHKTLRAHEFELVGKDGKTLAHLGTVGTPEFPILVLNDANDRPLLLAGPSMRDGQMCLLMTGTDRKTQLRVGPPGEHGTVLELCRAEGGVWTPVWCLQPDESPKKER